MGSWTWPWWLRVQLAALIYAAGMYLWYRDGEHSLVVTVVSLVTGEVFAVVLFLGARFQRRRLLRDDPASADRPAVERAVLETRIPDDPRLAGAATRLARQWADPGMQPAHQLFLFGWLLVIALILAIYLTPWAWCGVAVTPVLTWFSLRADRRRRDAGWRYLRAVDESPAS